MNVEQTDKLIIFGASYCQTALQGIVLDPTPERPFGFPREDLTTYAERDSDNWVIYLQNSKPGEKALVWNYAKGGETTEGVIDQVDTFLNDDPPAGVDLANTDSTLVCIWVGINDVCFAGMDPEKTVAKLVEKGVRELCDAGLRKFLIYEVPPRMREPKATFKPTPGWERHHERIEKWNTALHAELENLKAEYHKLEIAVFPSWNFFNDIMDDAQKYGFTDADPGRAYGGKIWVDGLHPTSAVHEHIAKEAIRVLQTHTS